MPGSEHQSLDMDVVAVMTVKDPHLNKTRKVMDAVCSGPLNTLEHFLIDANIGVFTDVFYYRRW